MRKVWVFISVIVFFSSLGTVQAADKKAVIIALDAEFSLLNSTSAQSIKLGIDTAIAEINSAGGVLNGRPLKLISKDNRSMPARGIHNIRELAKVKDLVAVFSGRFSPVVLETIPMLQQTQMINLAPWSSADGVTENSMSPNYIFRLSLKDRYAMPAMLKFAADNGANKIGLLLTNTSWGRSNLKAAERYLQKTGSPLSVGTAWYNWRDKTLMQEYQILLKAGAQAIILVANDDEGASLVSEMVSLPKDQRLPIISHWGVTGGDFIGQMKTADALDQINFSVVQTFSLFSAKQDKVADVMQTVRRISTINNVEQIDAPVGFGHAYDLTHILAKAINLAGTTERKVIRDKLEQVRDYDGIVKYFKRPFSAQNHDALILEDVFMARYHADGTIRPIKK
ncbi:MAG: ABC transporter substrate-binding protein [Gammaproteobacteria bacterium]|nr:ABC transporter substrate-binding protein [Gammaproteobacteria bacterium]